MFGTVHHHLRERWKRKQPSFLSCLLFARMKDWIHQRGGKSRTQWKSFEPFASFFLRTSNLVNQEKSLLWTLAVFSQNQRIARDAVFVIIFVFLFFIVHFFPFCVVFVFEWLIPFVFFASCFSLCSLVPLTVCFVLFPWRAVCRVALATNSVGILLIVHHAEGR